MARTVAVVADDGVADAVKVTPELVLPAGLGLGLHQGEATEPLQAAVAGHGIQGLLPPAVRQLALDGPFLCVRPWTTAR